MEKLEPQFEEMHFPTQKEFERWLVLQTKQIIDLDNYGQDLLKVWVNESGEILHTNLQAPVKIWNGRFVNMEALAIDEPIQLQSLCGTKWKEFVQLVPNEIETK